MQLYEVKLGVAEEGRRTAELGLREGNRGPLAERKAEDRTGAVAAHGVQRQRRDDYRVLQIVDRNGHVRN